MPPHHPVAGDNVKLIVLTMENAPFKKTFKTVENDFLHIYVKRVNAESGELRYYRCLSLLTRRQR